MVYKLLLYFVLCFATPWLFAAPAVQNAGDVGVQLVFPAVESRSHVKAPVVAVLWLTPLHGSSHGAPGGSYTLAQKNRQFSPHLLIVPVGSTVHFPNKDPYFHNVFSLFDGRRFDLGLYEAGTTRDVVFSQEGVSYIFCNIHPEMSAVVLSLGTRYYAVADGSGRFELDDVPAGAYMMRVWVEGASQDALNALSRVVQIPAGHTDLGAITLPAPPAAHAPHANKFGQPYDPNQTEIY